jgi:MerR family redox-sensitive transcriptional activator SoxR
MREMTIGEVARKAGVRASALRFYEDAGVLPRAHRVNGRRRYSEELLDLIQVARFARSVGFSVAEIRALFKGFQGRSKLGAQWRPLAKAKLRELDGVIAKARRMKAAIELGLECGCIRVEDCLPSRRPAISGATRRAPRSRSTPAPQAARRRARKARVPGRSPP